MTVRALFHCWLLAFAAALLPGFATAQSKPPESERHYLSGHGPSDAVPWEFTVTKGRRAGEATTIPVPSNWEQHGFGTYEYGQADKSADEHGRYRLNFAVPDRFEGQRLRIVFEGVMTDTVVRVNGQQVGPTHQGGFYRFHYDVTDALKFGSGKPNLLEVDVAKVSANAKTERAERGGDYWVFGGIFRPVWIEARPMESIETVAVDARADGALSAVVSIAGGKDADRVEGVLVDTTGKPVGGPVAMRIPAGGAGRLTFAARYAGVQAWTSETPNLYRLHLTLLDGDTPLHRVTTRIGFRTLEVRAGDGLYLNGKRILLKGVNRHAFRPDTGRTLDPRDSYDDVRLIKSMNMNAVRMSHYPPDEALLEAADELGLYVIDELSGWQAAHDTQVGRLLVRAMIERDVNHPSILFWANGNEGGFNRDLDGDYALWDPQRRHVLHPWETHDDLDTKHYPDFAEFTRRLAGPNLLMPTEMIHALYDGGGAAGLSDYWRALKASPVGAGGFIWVFADEGIARTDRGGAIDTFGTYAPDGLVGPRHEKEASYFAVRDIWSPIVVAPPVLEAEFDGQLSVRNDHDFVSLEDIRFDWRLRDFAGPDGKGARVRRSGRVDGAAIAAGTSGTIALTLPGDWRDADALELVATRGKDAIHSWTWPIDGAPPLAPVARMTPVVERSSDAVTLRAGQIAATFDAQTGTLRHVERGGKRLSLSGPVLDWARPDAGIEPAWTQLASAVVPGEFDAATPTMQNLIDVDLGFAKGDTYAQMKIEVTADRRVWTTIFDGARRPGDGTRYIFTPQPIAAIRVTDLSKADGGPIAVRGVRAGFQPTRFPSLSASTLVRAETASRDGAAVAEVETSGGGFDSLRWTLHGDGTLDLAYRYALDGPVLFHGISFSQPTDRLRRVMRSSDGPHPVWRNRSEGVQPGVHTASWEPASAAPDAERTGYFSGLRWVRTDTADGDWVATRLSGPAYLRIGTRRVDHSYTSVDFPRGDISFLAAIPGIGSKFVKPENSGPGGQAEVVSGSHEGSLRFTFP